MDVLSDTGRENSGPEQGKDRHTSATRRGAVP